MLKKYFILVFIFASFAFASNQAFAAFTLVTGGNTCTSKSINATATNIVSEADLTGQIGVCIVTGSNLPFNVLEQSTTYKATTSINSNVGTTTVTMPYVFEKASIFGNESIKYTISDNANPVNTDTATISAYVDVMPITLSNNKSIANNGSLGVGQSITFTCTNSTELYYDPVVGQTNTPVVSDYTGSKSYNLVYTVTPVPGVHKVECSNIGGASTRKTFTFTAQNNKLDITNANYSPSVAMAPINFTWTSNGTNCSFYNYDKSVKFGNASGNAGSGFSYNLASPNFPSRANSYGYYIKCYDSTKPNSDINTARIGLASSTERINGVNTTVAWYPVSATFTCPSGYSPDNANGNACVENTKLDITNANYSPSVAMAPINFTWTSNGTNCSFYNYDKSVKFGNASGNAGSGFSYNLASPNFPSRANSYGYYIKCYDSTNPNIVRNTANTLLEPSTEIISGVSTNVAWYPITASFTCPDGYLADSNNSNICTLVPPPPPIPSCAFTDSSSESISCDCVGGSLTSLIVDSTDGSSQTISPPTSPFAWSDLQYRYRLSCGTYTALSRPYSHFLSFNVSAGYVKPGGAIDMNWVVQDPVATCKIVGVDLKSGAEIFNTDSGNYNAVQNSITVSKTNSSRNFSDGSFKNLMGTALTVNNSARFTASCYNNSTYKPGYYKLVRDVYTTTSQER